MVREEVNLLHERVAQLALVREGVEQAGVNSSMVGYGRGSWRGAPKDVAFPQEGCSAWFQLVTGQPKW